MNNIRAQKARYIKLGENGRWETLGLGDGTLRVQFFEMPHELGQRRDVDAVARLYKEQGKDPKTARMYANQIAHFYDGDPEVLWITFAHGYLWWTFAAADVHFLGTDPVQQSATGTRYRRAVGGWRNTTLAGELLTMESLPGGLRQTAGTQSTICKIRPDYLEGLLRRINGEADPLIIKAEAARHAALEVMQELMKELNHDDFEVFVDLTFTRLGWQRTGMLGKTQKTVDMHMMLPATGERAFVQVKSRTTAAELAMYEQALRDRGEARMYYAYHTSSRPLTTTNSRVTLLDAVALAKMAWKGGLFDWLTRNTNSNS